MELIGKSQDKMVEELIDGLILLSDILEVIENEMESPFYPLVDRLDQKLSQLLRSW